MGGCKEDGARFFSVMPGDKTRGKLKHRRLPLNVRKHFFTVRVMEHWHRLPREVVGWRYSKAAWTWSWATGSR